MSNVRTQIGKVIGKSLNSYHSRVKPKIDELKFKEQYQGRIIDCMVGEVDDNYIETPETDEKVVKLEHSKDGVVKIARIKGKTILVDEEGNETDTPSEGCRLVSVGEDEDNKLIILSKNKNLITKENLVRGRLGDDGISTEIADAPSLISKDFINISGIEYISLRRTLGTHQNSNHAQISFYDKDKNKIGINYYDGATSKQSVPNGAIFAKFRVNMDNTDIYFGEYINIDQYQYIEPKYHKTEILLKEPLREGDYIEGKKIYRNVKQDGLTLIPLEEPIIEELPNSITLQGFDDTTMYIENTITPTVSYGYNALIPYKQELLNQKEEVETNTLDIEQNIIPYLMDMEFNLMLMGDNE